MLSGHFFTTGRNKIVAILRPVEDEQLDDREVEIDSDNKFVG
jgi:hypothetical protein